MSRSILFMLLSAALFGSVPVWVGLSFSETPFGFAAFGHLVSLPVLMFAAGRRMSLGGVRSWPVLVRCFFPEMLGPWGEHRRQAVLSRFWMVGLVACAPSYAVFSFASSLGELPVAAVLYESWPLASFMLLTAFPAAAGLARRSPSSSWRWRDLTGWLGVGLCLASLWVVLLGRGLDPFSAAGLGGSLEGSWLGIGLSILSAAMLGGQVFFSLAVGRNLSWALRAARLPSDEMGCALVVTIFMASSGLLSSLILGFIQGESFSMFRLDLPGFLLAGAMGLAIGLGTVFFRMSIVGSANPGVVLLSFFSPLFAVSALAVLSLLGIATSGADPSLRFGVLGLGAVLLVGGNVLLEFSSRR